MDKMKAEMLKENMTPSKSGEPCLPKTLELSDYKYLNDFDEYGE